MDQDRFTSSLKKFLREVGVTSQQAVEAFIEKEGLSEGKLQLKMTLTAEGTELNHVVKGEIDLG